MEASFVNPLKNIADEAEISERPARVLAIDDEEPNLDILSKHLSKNGYEPVLALSGEEGLEYLEKEGDSISVILLDKMMPGMDGFDVLRELKANAAYKNIPVIMQTAATANEDIIEGMNSGAYYYVTKPYSAKMLLSIVNSAINETRRQSELSDRMRKTDAVLNLITRSEYEFKTIEEARALAAHLAKFSDDPKRTVLGLAALLVNAVEHGNLEVGRERKADLLAEGNYEQEIKRRLGDDELGRRRVRVIYKRQNKDVQILIKDEGKGFRWQDYMDFDPSRLTDPNGRGIATANIMNPGAFSYHGDGSQVIYKLDWGFEEK